jgi:methyltransferase (TIGR00027 family)
MFAAAASHEAGRKVPALGPEPGSELWAFFTSYMLAPTLFIDEQVKSAMADGARQVVLLAAGLDSRAARLDYPSGVKVFEIDREPVLAFKSRLTIAWLAITLWRTTDRSVPGIPLRQEARMAGR